MRTTLLPKYFKRFKCIGGNCEDTCCSGWDITVDQDSYLAYKTSDEIVLTKRFQEQILKTTDSTENKYGLIKATTAPCPFLNKQSLCEIQQRLGEEALCKTCKSYPRVNNLIDRQVERSLAFSCPEASRIILNLQQGIDFEVIEDQNHYDIKKWIEMDSADLVFTLRAVFIEILQNRNQTIEARLWMIGELLEQLTTLPSNQLTQFFNDMDNNLLVIEGNMKLIKSDCLERIEYAQAYFEQVLSLKFVSNRYRSIGSYFFEAFNKEFNAEKLTNNYCTAEKKYDDYMKKYSYQLENYLVNTVFQHIVPFDKETIIESFYLLVFRFSIIKIKMLSVSEVEELSVDKVVEIVQTFSKLFEHDSDLLKLIYNKVYKEKKLIKENISKLIL